MRFLKNYLNGNNSCFGPKKWTMGVLAKIKNSKFRDHNFTPLVHFLVPGMIWVKVILHLSDIPAADEFRKKRLLRLTELFHIRSTWLGSVSDKNWYQSGGQSIGPTSKVGGSKKWLWLGARWLMIVTVKNKTIFDTKVGILYHNSNMNLSKFELILLALLILIVERYFPIHFALSSYINFCTFCTLLRPPPFPILNEI